MGRIRQKPFSPVTQRVLEALGLHAHVPPAGQLRALADVLMTPVETVRNWDKRGSIPLARLTDIAVRTNRPVGWLRYGLEEAAIGAPIGGSAAKSEERFARADHFERAQNFDIKASESPAPWALPARVASTHSRGSATKGHQLSALLQPRGTGAVLPLVLSVPLGERGGPTRDFELIPKHTRAASAGSGAPVSEDLVDRVGNLAFSFEWLRHNMGHTSGRLAEVRVQGDSMATTLLDGDTIIIDEGVTTVEVDGIYVLDVFGRRLVKRVQHLFDGTLVLISDNPSYQRETISRDRARDVVVIGRMVWPRVR